MCSENSPKAHPCPAGCDVTAGRAGGVGDELVVEVARLGVGAEVGLKAGLDAADFEVAGPGLDETGEKSQNRCRCVSFSVIHLSGAHHVRLEATNLTPMGSDSNDKLGFISKR